MFTRQDCLDLIHSGGADAYELLLAHVPDAGRRFNKLDKEIRDFLAYVRRVFPDACYYTASGGFNLMIGPDHDGRARPQQELVALHGLASIGDGDF